MAKNILMVKRVDEGYQLSNGMLVKSTCSTMYPMAIEEGDTIRLTTGLFHLHTGYSLLDGAIKSKELAKMVSHGKDEVVEVDGKKVILCEYPQVIAITDHGNMFGSYEFNDALEKESLIPVIGVEIYCETISGQKKGNHLILLCKNEKGYHNLCKLLSEAEENFYNKPHVTWANLRKYSEGLVCLSACLAGEIPQALLKNNVDEAMEIAENFVDIFGEDFYIEIQNHHILDEDKIRPGLIKLAKELGVKTVCTTDSHYLTPEAAKAHEVLLCVQTGKTMSDSSHFKFDGDGYHVPTNEEFIKNFSFISEAIANQAEIAQKCEFRFRKKEITMPKFPTGDKSMEELFVENCWAGFHKRFDGKDIDVQKYKERLNYEISVIAQMKFQAYFLIVADFIGYAKKNGIAVGPGRGSAVGSLVSYCLEITNLDPIPYGLLFERFLNPERVSWPDIDIDFQDTRRQEVIDYVKSKYGAECVSRIITFGTLAARLVIRDVARAMDMPLTLADRVAKAIPAEPKMTIDKAMAKSLEFKTLYKDPEVKKLVDIARQLEGLPRHKSQHACGVIISAAPVDEFVPEVLLEDSNGEVARTAAFTMTELENLGLLKCDFLGLRNMGIIKNSLDHIGMSDEKIPLVDPYVYANIFANADTDGIFQVESAGMKGLMRDMFSDVKSKVRAFEAKYGFSSYEEAMQNKDAAEKFNAFGKECFERLIAAIALYRPGPMDYIPQYIAGMKNPSSIHYDCKELESILSNTYGVLVYQEQVQEACRKMAGYSLGRADLIRRAMGKKKLDVMLAEQEIFLHGNANSRKEGEALVPGCIANGISEEAAKTVWDKMVEFANYAFNKSHAAGYAVISVQTAWIKLYHPTEFWAETMNSVITKTDKLKKYISSAKAGGMNLLSPDINESMENFSIVKNGEIRMGLVGLRNVGKSSKPIIDERENNGKFKSFEDFVSRLMPEKRSYESLVYSGALDEFTGSRRAKIQAMDSINEYKDAMKAFKDMWFEIPELDTWYKSFFSISVPETSEMSNGDKLEKEYLYAGMYVSAHPLDEFKMATRSFGYVDISDLTEEDDDDEGIVKGDQEKPVTIIGVVKEFEQKLTKKGDTMYVFRVEDTTGSIRVTMFPREVEMYGDDVYENAVVRIDGTWKNNDFGVQVVVSSVIPLKEIGTNAPERYLISADAENIKQIISVIDEYADNSDDGIAVIIHMDNTNKEFVIDSDTSKSRRAISIDKMDTASFVKVSPSLEAFGAIRKIARIL